MRIEKLSIRGLLRFTDTITLDLRDLPPGLIAITGENGSGKTTVLEAGVAAIYRSFLSREGELYDYAGGARDSFLEAEVAFDGQGLLRARVNIDGLKRTTDAVLMAIAADGSQQPLNDGKATTFDAAVRERFPARELLLASAFAAQNKTGSFVTLEKKDRKALFASLLGLERYQAMSDTAKQAATGAEHARGRLEAVRAELARDTDPRLLADLDRQAADLTASGSAAGHRQGELAQSIVTLESRLALLVDEVAAYASATLRIQTIRAEWTTRTEERRRVDLEAEAAETAADREVLQIVDEKVKQLADIDKRVAGNEQVRGRADDIRGAVAVIARIDADLLALRGRLDTLQGDIDRLNREDNEAARLEVEAATHANELLRVRRDAELLEQVPCGGRGAFAACQFIKNAAAAMERIPGLEQSAANKAALADARARIQKDHRAATAAMTAGRQERRDLEAERTTQLTTAKYADALAAAEARLTELHEQRAACLVTHQRQVEAAAERYQDIQRAVTDRRANLDGLLEQLNADVIEAQGDLVASRAGNARSVDLQSALLGARLDRDAVIGSLARVESGLQELGRRRLEVAEKACRQTDVGQRIDRISTELLEWQALAKAFGRDGLPVLEIDAAGPTISSYTNELLQVCFGARFSVELVTQRAKADGKGFVDDFSIAVFDNTRGGEARDIKDLSGGEQVIVSEALMNAIAVYVNTRSPMPIRTCWRDETTGALDPENATRYLAMLRKVQDLGGFHHVLFITHNPDAAAMADAQIQVASGQAAIVLPPFREAA